MEPAVSRPCQLSQHAGDGDPFLSLLPTSLSQLLDCIPRLLENHRREAAVAQLGDADTHALQLLRLLACTAELGDCAHSFQFFEVVALLEELLGCERV